MGAFRGAVAVGAHALETDIHLSRDGVVVLSHDASLKRCFGINQKIADCDWSYLSTLQTLREPRQSLPRLSDLLEYLAQPGLESVWVLLDIKMDDDPDDLLSRTAETIASAPTTRPWNERILLGGWNENYLELCKEYFPGFPVAYIGFTLLYAKRFLEQPQVNFNLAQRSLVGPAGRYFVKAIREARRALFVWTVNDEEWMEWSIRKKVDGVITDNPRLFLDVCSRWEAEGRGSRRWRVPSARGVRLYLTAFCIQALQLVFTALLWRKLNSMGKRRQLPLKPLESI
ncbi:PLC-like phosphodiesterase [Lasiosphaeria miniovina]|uniref:PLC-like phosphodiesterase n=1 Tax=Lasiosphaeria miniovina TaxID=1954250 RepID=A0AA40E644_9PEZI|nr:PLC-like phosphodiesterase [Lasiosphaeria miniovina]KAK0728420.1 PLC-like phosphodiesterase [Lasiosphaeria miniovina]